MIKKESFKRILPKICFQLETRVYFTKCDLNTKTLIRSKKLKRDSKIAWHKFWNFCDTIWMHAKGDIFQTHEMNSFSHTIPLFNRSEKATIQKPLGYKWCWCISMFYNSSESITSMWMLFKRILLLTWWFAAMQRESVV